MGWDKLYNNQGWNNNNLSPWTHEGSPLDRVWEEYLKNLFQETTDDGLLKELEGYIDVGFESHILEEWKLPGGLPFEFEKEDDGFYLTPETGLYGIDVLKLYNRIKIEYKTDSMDWDEEKNREINKKRIRLLLRVVSNMIGENGFLRKKKKYGLVEQFVRMKQEGTL